MGGNDSRAKRRKIRSEYDTLYREVAAVLYRHDPVGLAAAGAPDDEYYPEAGTILPALRRAAFVEDVRRIAHREFVSWFDAGLAGPEEGYEWVARDIWAAWCRRRYDIEA